jgi:hypothetical protein
MATSRSSYRITGCEPEREPEKEMQRLSPSL